MLFEILPIAAAHTHSAEAPNTTVIHIAVSALLFIIVWQVLARVFFKPVFKVLEEREARTIGDQQKADKLKEEARELTRNIESQLMIARTEGIRARDSMIAKSEREAKKILEHGQKQATAKLKAGQLEIHRLKENAKKELVTETVKLADETFRRILTQNQGNYRL